MEETVIVEMRVTPQSAGLAPPTRYTPEASGLDLRAAIDCPITLLPHRRAKIPTGIMISLPPGYEAQVRPRSGLADRAGVTVLNAPATIDNDYRGEIKVLLINLGDEPWTIHRGDRIAQLVVAPVVKAILRPVLVFTESETGRGEGGFGSTGVR